MIAPSLEAFIRKAPKVDLHRHLVGSATVEVIAALAARHPDIGVPSEPGAVQTWFEFTDFAHFIEVYDRTTALVRTGEDIVTIIEGAAGELARENTRYAEMTVTPYSRLRRGMSTGELNEALAEGRRRARGLGVELAWVYDIAGELGAVAAEATTRAAVDSPPEGLVGFGLGGIEIGVDRGGFAPWFDRARASGLKSVPHAGESDGPSSIIAALDRLGADRIGHGIRAIDDDRLLKRLAAEQIPLEVCPSSNVCTGVVENLAAHPLPALLDAGVLVTINTDDPPMFSTTLTAEYLGITAQFDLGLGTVEQLLINGVEASFLDRRSKEALVAEITALADSRRE